MSEEFSPDGEPSAIDFKPHTRTDLRPARQHQRILQCKSYKRSHIIIRFSIRTPEIPTSSRPVVKSNAVCEGVRDGTTGCQVSAWGLVLQRRYGELLAWGLAEHSLVGDRAAQSLSGVEIQAAGPSLLCWHMILRRDLIAR